MKIRRAHLPVVLAMLFASTYALAEVRFDYSLWSSGTPAQRTEQSFRDVSGTFVSDTISFLGTTSSFSANSATGELKASVQAASNSAGIASSVRVIVADTVIFSGGFGQIGFLDYALEGEILDSSETDFTSTYGGFTVSLSNSTIGGSSSYGLSLASPGTCPRLLFSNLGCTEASSLFKTGSIPFEITNGNNEFLFNLFAVAAPGDTADFGNSANFFLRLPDGVTYQSATGSFLSTAQAITPVPEAPTWLMFAFGLVALAMLVKPKQRNGRACFPSNSQPGMNFC